VVAVSAFDLIWHTQHLTNVLAVALAAITTLRSPLSPLLQ